MFVASAHSRLPTMNSASPASNARRAGRARRIAGVSIAPAMDPMPKIAVTQA